MATSDRNTPKPTPPALDDRTRPASPQAAPPAPIAAGVHEPFLQMLDALPGAVYVTDAHGRITYFNPAAAAFAGRTPALGEDRWSITKNLFLPDGTPLPPEQSPAAVAINERRAITGIEAIAQRPDGTRAWGATYSTPLRNSENEVVGAINMIVDITDQKRIEMEADRAADQFQTLIYGMPLGVYVVDADLRIRHINPSTRQAFGDIADLIGRPLTEIVAAIWPVPYADEIMQRFRHTLETGESYFSGERVEQRLDRGGLESYAWQLSRIPLPEGGFGVACYFTDITARLRAERAMRESEVRYRRLFQTAKDGILILDAETGRITDANAFMAALVGLEPADLLGKELYQIGMFGDIEANKAAFRELQQTGYLRHDHLPIRDQRGEEVAVEFVANVYMEGDKRVAQCNIRDIADRSRLEAELATQAAAMVVQAQAKDDFLAMLSHELRNPLAPIRAAVHLMKLQERTPGVEVNSIMQQAREVIERQVANLTRIISDLSEVSRVISGNIRIDKLPINLSAITRHALETVAPIFEQRKHSVSLSLEPEPAWVAGDAARLEEVLINVLNNAAKYTPDGGRISISCQSRREGTRHYALVRIRDNGIGIEAALLPRVFDAFTQADRSLDRAAGGLGIGLSLAHRLVSLHGGTITGHSDGPGKGSEFTIKLPLIAPPEPASTPGETPLTKTATSAAGAPATRVLVVDDNVDFVTMLCGTLAHKGYQVRFAHNGPDGLLAATKWQPDIALLDIGLPGLDGYELARKIRAREADAASAREHAPRPPRDGVASPAMKLIAITGYGRDADVELARKAGFDAHMLKPCDVDVLESLMHQDRVGVLQPAAAGEASERASP